MFVLCYYVIVEFVAHLYFATATGDQDNFAKEVVDYFECEYYGNISTCTRKHFEKYVHPGLNATSTFMMGLLPVANLVFIVNWRRVGQELRQFCGRFQQKVHEVEVEDIHSNLSPHPDSIEISSSTYENSIEK